MRCERGTRDQVFVWKEDDNGLMSGKELNERQDRHHRLSSFPLISFDDGVLFF